MTLQFPCGDVHLEDLGVHSTRVDHLTQMRLNLVRSIAESIKTQMPGIGTVLSSAIEDLAAAIAAGAAEALAPELGDKCPRRPV